MGGNKKRLDKRMEFAYKLGDDPSPPSSGIHNKSNGFQCNSSYYEMRSGCMEQRIVLSHDSQNKNTLNLEEVNLE
jgi:hypothetical protein